MVSTNLIKLCTVCGEDATHIHSGDKHVVRVRRYSKCKQYRRTGQHCATDVVRSEGEAVKSWNRSFASGRKVKVKEIPVTADGHVIEQKRTV